ncbi:MAG TPA: hypothetical protein VH478_14430 [Trebonia sp.]|nr:hypothetical protein [Trebonia sp.]
MNQNGVGMTSAAPARVLEGGQARPPGAPARRGPLSRLRLDRASTPARLRWALAWLTVATLAWGALATITASQHASGAGTVVAASEPLAFDALTAWESLSDANDEASAAILAGSLPPQAVVARYQHDLDVARTDILDAARRGGPAADLGTLTTGLDSYQDEVSRALANNQLGYPVGAAYLRQASALMTRTLLPLAHDLYTTEDARLTSTSAQATGLPLIVVTIVAGIALGVAYWRCGRWVHRRTNRVVNAGLLLAGVAGTIAAAWLGGAYLAGRADLLTAQSQGSTPVQALASADIAVLKAHSDEALTLVNNSGDDPNEADFGVQRTALGPGPGTLLTVAAQAAGGSPGAARASAASAAATAWFAQHALVRADDNGKNPGVAGGGTHQEAVGLVVSGPAGKAFQALSGDLNEAITADNAAFAAQARSGQSAFSGLVPGMVAITLIMAAALTWGLSRRLAEYR